MDIPNIIGIVAGIFTTLAFLPQVIKTWKMKETKDLSLGMFLMFTLGVLLWLIYGIMINSMPVILANAGTIILAGIILFFKIKYG